MKTTQAPLLVILLSHAGCARNGPSPLPHGSATRPPTPAQEISNSSLPASKQPSPPSAAAQDVVSLQITAVASSPGSHAFRLRERALVWFKAPGCPAAGITPSLRQDSTELTRIAEEHTIELPSGVYRLGFSWPDVDAPKDTSNCTVFFQARYLAEAPCSAKDALFGVLPFDSEAPSVESIGDINADGREDHRVTFSASPTQMGTRVVVSQEPPACVRTVFDGVGHVVPLPESKNGWKRIYFLESEYLATGAPDWLARTYGSTWSVTWYLDYETSSQSYRKSDAPVRCERTDGVQRALGDPGPNARATLIPNTSCRPSYWQRND